MPAQTLNARRLKAACIALSERDPFLRASLDRFGIPPLWDRPQGFATLLHIILEQQVSLASAKACFEKLTAYVGDVCPDAVLNLSDPELRGIGFSRQKAGYARHLAESVMQNKIDLDGLVVMSDSDARVELQKLKGVGNWTADIYLLMAMLRPDVMPKGDLALHIGWQKISGGSGRPSADEFLQIAERWRPHRSAAARMLWHYYLSERRA